MADARPARALLPRPQCSTVSMIYDAPPTQSPHLHAAPPPPKPSSPRAAPSLQQWTPKISGTGAGPAAVAGSVAAACAKFDTLDTIFQAELDAARTRLTVEPTLQLGASDAVSASSGSEAVAGSRCAPSSQASLHQTAPSPSLSSTLSALVQTQKLLARQHARLSSRSQDRRRGRWLQMVHVLRLISHPHRCRRGAGCRGAGCRRLACHRLACHHLATHNLLECRHLAVSRHRVRSQYQA